MWKLAKPGPTMGDQMIMTDHTTGPAYAKADALISSALDFTS